MNQVTIQTHFTVTPPELAAGTLNAEKLAMIGRAVEEAGYAVVSGLIPEETCRMLTTSVLEDVAQIRAVDTPTPHEQRTGQGHLQLGLRRYAPFVSPDLVANPLIENVVAAVLGRGAWLGFYNGNVNCPGSDHQPLHFDRPFSWRTPEEAARDGKSWPPPSTTLSCSVALTDITEENGATEIYPGTHRETATIPWPPGERVSEHPELIAEWGPPEYMTIPAGGICFRDPRMWHRGVPNPTAIARPMIALTYHAAIARHWRGLLVHDIDPLTLARCQENDTLRLLDNGELGDGRLVFQVSARAAFEAPAGRHGINRNVRFVEDPFVVNHFVDAHLIGGARVTSDGKIAPHV